MKALILNTTLKTGDEPSHTEALANEVIDIYHKEILKLKW